MASRDSYEIASLPTQGQVALANLGLGGRLVHPVQVLGSLERSTNLRRRSVIKAFNLPDTYLALVDVGDAEIGVKSGLHPRSGRPCPGGRLNLEVPGLRVSVGDAELAVELLLVQSNDVSTL
eukprot:753932-Hanusia_phi.AAC.3